MVQVGVDARLEMSAQRGVGYSPASVERAQGIR